MDGEIDRENRDYIYGLDRSIRLERLISLIDRYMDRIDRGRVGTLVPNPPTSLSLAGWSCRESYVGCHVMISYDIS